MTGTIVMTIMLLSFHHIHVDVCLLSVLQNGVLLCAGGGGFVFYMKVFH